MIHIALPVLDESSQLPAFLEMLGRQTYGDIILHVCVNQPEEWWEHPEKKRKCLDNQVSLEMLRNFNDLPVRVIDRASKGQGWIGKRHGVGWARKTVMDGIDEMASPHDIIVSLDADTTAGPAYLASVAEAFARTPEAMALAVPYYHMLTGNEEADRAILRYELYMRNYNIHLLRMNNPYAFTALGSAMAFPLWAYRKIGGMTPKMSGEDFYFLQKMVKAGKVLRWNPEKVYPAARFSDRVYFGTGPAMEKGRRGDWDSYPIYHHSLFQKISDLQKVFPILFYKDIQTPIDSFINEKFNSINIWNSLRDNYKNEISFVRACHTQFDGLRILQYLKEEQKKMGLTDEDCLVDNLRELYSELLDNNTFDYDSLSFTLTSLEILDKIRNELVMIEERLQQDFTDLFYHR